LLTPLHHDGTNVLFAQVYGRKHFKMIPSFEIHKVYNNKWVFSEVDAGKPDLEKFPNYAKATVIDVIVEPGDMLLIPVGWWHWVYALDVSISLNFQNFNVPRGNTVWSNNEWFN
jgi:ribosomal protein L16 Arg81 hydroxylase